MQPSRCSQAQAALTASWLVVMEPEMKLMVIVAELLFFSPSNEAGGSLEVVAVYSGVQLRWNAYYISPM